MKKFEFRLQSTMDWRERRAEQEKTELERLHSEQTRLRQSRESLQGELHTLSHQAHQQAVTTSEALHQMAMFSQSLHNLDLRLHSEEKHCGLQIVKQREKCVEADRNHKLLIHLRENRRQEWLTEFDREQEQNATESWNARRSREARRPR